MEVKSTLEVAFEWFCECGAFEQLRKQSKCYSADSTEKTVYRFVFKMDLMDLLDFNATLGNLAIVEPLNAINVFQETDLPSVAKWTVKANFDKFQLRSISSWNLAGNGQPNLMKICGIISGITAVTQYTQSARFYCPHSDCLGSAKYCYIRVHMAGKTENVTVRSDFVCRYCGCSLLEDVTCRTLADKCIVQVISPLTVDRKLWINTGCGKFYQTIPIYVRDELIREVQIGCYCSFVLLPSCEIHSSSLQLHCTPVFEANNIEKMSSSPFLNLLPSGLPNRIEMLHKASVTPPGTFFHLKMFLLMSLLLLHSSDCPEDTKQAKSRHLHLLVIADDLLRIQRLFLYMASFAKRMLVYSPPSDLFSSCCRDPFGSGTFMINAGCISLASDGVCLIPNAAVLKKDEKDKLQCALENGCMAVKVPEKFGPYQGRQVTMPLTSSVWVCSEPSQKSSHHAVPDDDPVLNMGLSVKECSTLPRVFVDQFSLVFNLSGSAEQFENSDESVCEEVLRKALDHEEDEDVMFISDEEMSQFLHHAGQKHVSLTVAAKDLIQGYYLASRRTKNSLSTVGADFPSSALQHLTSLAIAHAKLSLRSEVSEEDAVMAIVLYEDSIKWKYGYSGLGPVDPPSPSSDGAEFFGPKNDIRMEQIQERIRRFCSTFKDGHYSPFKVFVHEE
nr:minichromosome maintenance domain-containing protein 2-like [Pocillopora verrucosa]